MASPRSSSSSGRTPPFILVGLIVLVCFLAYNYWSLSSQNSELMGELEAIRLKARDVSDENKQNKESLDSVRVELSKAKLSIESHRAQANQWGKEKGALNEQISTKNSEVDTCKTALETCNENQKTEQEAKLAAEAEKETLQTQLQALKDEPKTCDRTACTGPVREVVVVAAKLTGTNSLGNALAQAGFDAAQLLEGINIPAPQAAAQEAKPAAPVEAQASAAEAVAPAAAEAVAPEAAAAEAVAPEAAAAAPEAVAPANQVNESVQADAAVQANESVQAQDGSAPGEAQAQGGQEAALQAADQEQQQA